MQVEYTGIYLAMHAATSCMHGCAWSSAVLDFDIYNLRAGHLF